MEIPPVGECPPVNLPQFLLLLRRRALCTGLAASWVLSLGVVAGVSAQARSDSSTLEARLPDLKGIARVVLALRHPILGDPH